MWYITPQSLARIEGQQEGIMSELTLVDQVNHPIALLVQSLLDRDQRAALGQIIIDDEDNILQAILANVALEMVLTTDKEQLSEKLLRALPKHVPVIEFSKRTAKKIFGGEKVSRDFAIAKMPRSIALHSLSAMKRDFVVLDHLTISGNIGAIIRTSMALSAGAIVLLGTEHVDVYDRRVIRASRGFVFRMPIVTVTANELIEFCKQNVIKLVATTSYAEHSIAEVAQDVNRLAIIFGTEKEGCSADLFNAAHMTVKIPLNSAVESLNVSVAASIILYLRDAHYRMDCE